MLALADSRPTTKLDRTTLQLGGKHPLHNRHFFQHRSSAGRKQSQGLRAAAMLTPEQLKDYEDKGGHLILSSRFVALALGFVNSYI